MARLPQPGSDKGTWGQVLNDFLLVAHNSDGSLKATPSSTTVADGSITQSKLSAGLASSGQVLSSNGSSLVWTTPSAQGSISDASTSSKGIIQLAGDLAGTAASPTVPGLASKANDTSVVHNTGNESVAGTKNFTGALQVGGQAVVATNDSRLTNQRIPVDASITPAKLDSANTATNGQILSYNGSKLNWVAAPSGGSDPVLGGELSGTASNASILANAITTAKIANDAITEPKLAVSNTPATDQVLSWNGSAMAWLTPTSGGGSAGISASQTIYADNVPSGSGLSNVAGNNSTDDSGTLQAQLDYIKSTWTAGTLVLPSNKTMRILTGLVVPSGVRIVGDRTPTIRYPVTSGAAITINDGSRTPLQGFRLFGPASGNQSGMSNQGTSVGINISGARNTFRELEIRSFKYGINLVNSDTYINTFDSLLMGNNEICVFADIVNVSGTTTPANNSGEKTVFDNCLFDNSPQAIYYSAPGSSLFFTNTSIDYVRKFATFSDVVVGFTNCHLEATGGTLAPPVNGNPRYMFELLYSARVTLTNVSIILAGATSPHGSFMLVQAGTNPGGASAFMHLNSVFAYFTSPDGTNRNVKSETTHAIAQGATSFTTYVPWSPKWSATDIKFIFHNGTPVPDNVTPKITSFSDTTGQIDVTFSAALPAAAVLQIAYGK